MRFLRQLADGGAGGGPGLSAAVAKLVEEMICATNVSFSLYPGLTHGATTAMEGHASDALKATYMAKMVSGEWSGTMCLTEPHCGTDLGMLRTRAVPQADGSYRLTGAKIFITAGEHDLTSNIIHLVLARLPDADIVLVAVVGTTGLELGTLGLAGLDQGGELVHQLGPGLLELVEHGGLGSFGHGFLLEGSVHPVGRSSWGRGLRSPRGDTGSRAGAGVGASMRECSELRGPAGGAPGRLLRKGQNPLWTTNPVPPMVAMPDG